MVWCMDLRTETILFYGDSGVGKTSVINQWLHHTFDSSQRTKSPLTHSNKKFSQGGASVYLSIYDTSGEKRYAELWPPYARFSKCIVLVFDVQNAASFQSVQTYLETAKEIENGQLNTQYFLLGNKCDLRLTRQVTERDAQRFAADNNVIYIETSAITGAGIQTLQEKILKIVRQIVDIEAPHLPPHIRHLDLVEQVHKFQTAWEKNPFVLDICGILKAGTQDANPQFYFTAKFQELKDDLLRLDLTWRSVLNSILNVAMTAGLAVSLVGLPLLAGFACTNLVASLVGLLLLGFFAQTNKKASGHSCMFFAFGERQAAQTMCHEVFTQLDTTLCI